MMKTYLFDWGDTLMVDFPQALGKMCDWQIVEAVEGAKETLAFLSQKTPIYIATNAVDSSEREIQLAFERVGLAQYITGYFCKANLGVGKESSDYFIAILEKLKLGSGQIIMVGDTLDKDILPAQKLGIEVIWFNKEAKPHQCEASITQICELTELCRLFERSE
ncbi:HAD family hydrolase [Vibrio algarum]|uniref:HAD family hydrolase n=1 Tax=Vibrio algarum TaxID=3020714 RepID=A0ABT4YYK9_9VIBR|nr:HAD family hydrolase [Vibrio sp. KJ40-1]MDB1126119.1 HAD family hydrolase [Vibrio sp. KJ40-1]